MMLLNYSLIIGVLTIGFCCGFCGKFIYQKITNKEDKFFKKLKFVFFLVCFLVGFEGCKEIILLANERIQEKIQIQKEIQDLKKIKYFYNKK